MEQNTVKPADLERALEHLLVGVSDAATLTGASVRQLNYWVDKGTLPALISGGNRVFNRVALEKATLIKRLLDDKYSLAGAEEKVEKFLKRQAEEKARLEELSIDELEAKVAERLTKLRDFARRVRTGLQSYQFSADLGRMTATSPDLQELVAYFQGNPFQASTARQIASKMGRESVEGDLERLAELGIVEAMRYPGGTVYRFVPGKRPKPTQKRRASQPVGSPLVQPSAGRTVAVALGWEGPDFRQGLEGLCKVLSCPNGWTELDLAVVLVRMGSGAYDGRVCLYQMAKEVAEYALLLAPGEVVLSLCQNRLKCQLPELSFVVELDGEGFSFSMSFTPTSTSKVDVGEAIAVGRQNGWHQLA